MCLDHFQESHTGSNIPPANFHSRAGGPIFPGVCRLHQKSPGFSGRRCDHIRCVRVCTVSIVEGTRRSERLLASELLQPAAIRIRDVLSRGGSLLHNWTESSTHTHYLIFFLTAGLRG